MHSCRKCKQFTKETPVSSGSCFLFGGILNGFRRLWYRSGSPKQHLDRCWQRQSSLNVYKHLKKYSYVLHILISQVSKTLAACPRRTPKHFLKPYAGNACMHAMYALHACMHECMLWLARTCHASMLAGRVHSENNCIAVLVAMRSILWKKRAVMFAVNSTS